jgi:hypothetical protein
MTATVTGAGYVMPVKYHLDYNVKSGTLVGAIQFSNVDDYVYAKYIGTATSYTGATTTYDLEAWAFKDGENYIAATKVTNPAATEYAIVTEEQFGEIKAAFAERAATSIKTSPASFSHFLKNFDVGTPSVVTVGGSSVSVILAGGSSTTLWMKSESYQSTGAGNLTATLNIGRTYGDEPVVYAWDNNRVIKEQNDATQSLLTYEWDTYTAEELDYSAYTQVTDVDAIEAKITSIEVLAEIAAEE